MAETNKTYNLATHANQFMNNMRAWNTFSKVIFSKDRNLSTIGGGNVNVTKIEILIASTERFAPYFDISFNDRSVSYSIEIESFNNTYGDSFNMKEDFWVKRGCYYLENGNGNVNHKITITPENPIPLSTHYKFREGYVFHCFNNLKTSYSNLDKIRYYLSDGSFSEFNLSEVSPTISYIKVASFIDNDNLIIFDNFKGMNYYHKGKSVYSDIGLNPISVQQNTNNVSVKFFHYDNYYFRNSFMRGVINTNNYMLIWNDDSYSTCILFKKLNKNFTLFVNGMERTLVCFPFVDNFGLFLDGRLNNIYSEYRVPESCGYINDSGYYVPFKKLQHSLNFISTGDREIRDGWLSINNGIYVFPFIIKF